MNVEPTGDVIPVSADLPDVAENQTMLHEFNEDGLGDKLKTKWGEVKQWAINLKDKVLGREIGADEALRNVSSLPILGLIESLPVSFVENTVQVGLDTKGIPEKITVNGTPYEVRVTEFNGPIEASHFMPKKRIKADGKEEILPPTDPAMKGFFRMLVEAEHSKSKRLSEEPDLLESLPNSEVYGVSGAFMGFMADKLGSMALESFYDEVLDENQNSGILDEESEGDGDLSENVEERNIASERGAYEYMHSLAVQSVVHKARGYEGFQVVSRRINVPELKLNFWVTKIGNFDKEESPESAWTTELEALMNFAYHRGRGHEDFSTFDLVELSDASYNMGDGFITSDFVDRYGDWGRAYNRTMVLSPVFEESSPRGRRILQEMDPLFYKRRTIQHEVSHLADKDRSNNPLTPLALKEGYAVAHELGLNADALRDNLTEDWAYEEKVDLEKLASLYNLPAETLRSIIDDVIDSTDGSSFKTADEFISAFEDHVNNREIVRAE